VRKLAEKHGGAFSTSNGNATDGPISKCVHCGKSLDCGNSPYGSTDDSLTSSSIFLKSKTYFV